MRTALFRKEPFSASATETFSYLSLEGGPMTLPRFKKNAHPRAMDAPPKNLLSPHNAWRILCRATGGGIARATFYRWLSSGKVYSIRLGFRIFVPWVALDELIKQCREGERF